MTEAISSLYAEIGFKVKEDGLQEFSKRIATLQGQLSSLSKTMKEISGIKFPKVSSGSLEKLNIQNIRANVSVARENRLREQFEYRKEKDKLRERKKEEQDKKRDRARFERNLKRAADTFLKGVAGAATFATTAFNSAWNISRGAAASSMSYSNYKLTTGDIPENLQRFQALAAATGAMGRNDVLSQLQGLSQNWAQLVQDQGNVYALKMLGLGAHQNPTEMAEAIMGALQRYKGSPALMTSLLSQLGLNASGWMRMANATPEQQQRAEQLQGLMLTPSEINALNDLYRDFSSLDDAVVSLKDKFGAAFSEVDPKLIKEMLDALSSEEAQRAIKATATALDGLARGIEFVTKGLYNTFSWLSEKTTEITTKNYKKGMDWITKKAEKYGLAKSILFFPFAPEIIGSFLDDNKNYEKKLADYGKIKNTLSELNEQRLTGFDFSKSTYLDNGLFNKFGGNGFSNKQFNNYNSISPTFNVNSKEDAKWIYDEITNRTSSSFGDVIEQGI